ncbi:MAG: hypothetical protein JSU94_06180 [Phycisphaerales bacterium]|nr:MAG: hypothetical protein JSU94_06180 [Phycisphaerales bacterium]
MPAGILRQLRAGVNQACTSSGCHNYDTVLNHPLDASAAGESPVDKHLDGSRITCLTCHNPSRSPDEAADANESQDRRLRVPAGKDFCASCHARMPGTPEKTSHWQSSKHAHLGRITSGSVRADNTIRFLQEIDTESRTCLSCHDSIAAATPCDGVLPGSGSLRTKRTGGHPIGMEYARVAMEKSSKYKYRYPLANAHLIRLPNGKVGCGTCHSPYSDHPAHLVRSNLRSALCLECHDM